MEWTLLKGEWVSSGAVGPSWYVEKRLVPSLRSFDVRSKNFWGFTFIIIWVETPDET